MDVKGAWIVIIRGALFSLDINYINVTKVISIDSKNAPRGGAAPQIDYLYTVMVRLPNTENIHIQAGEVTVHLDDIEHPDTSTPIMSVVLQRFPEWLAAIYRIVGEQNAWTYKGWRFKSLTDIVKYWNEFQWYVEIARSYHGMGHWNVLSMIEYQDLYFTTIRGGSDQHSREYDEKLAHELCLNDVNTFTADQIPNPKDI